MDIDERETSTMLIGLILDATLSFTSVYPEIYYMLERLMISLGEKTETESVKIKYAVILIHDHEEELIWKDGTIYTDDDALVLQKLSEIEFYGGRRDGRENLDEAIDILQRSMGVYDHCCAVKTSKVMILITDSLPYGDMFPDHTDPAAFNDENCSSNGIDAVYIYSYSDEYMPQIRMNGDFDRRMGVSKGICVSESLKTLLECGEQEMINKMDRMAEEIMTNINLSL